MKEEMSQNKNVRRKFIYKKIGKDTVESLLSFKKPNTLNEIGIERIPVCQPQLKKDEECCEEFEVPSSQCEDNLHIDQLNDFAFARRENPNNIRRQEDESKPFFNAGEIRSCLDEIETAPILDVSQKIMNGVRHELGENFDIPNVPNVCEPQYNSNLPVFAFRNQILKEINNSSVILISASTGSGKSTQVPQYILDDCIRQRKPCNIVITQPRRIAAMSVARRVCDEREWPLGSLCGYQFSLHKECCTDTRILYCTTGTLLQKLLMERNLNQYTHVILDEAHERAKEMDFLFLLVRRYVRTISRHVKVIIMSASMNIEEIANYFSLYENGEMKPARVISIDKPLYHVEEMYLESFKLRKIPDFEVDEPNFPSVMYDIVVEILKEIDLMEKEANTNLDPMSSLPYLRPTALIFLPGLYEIMTLDDILKQESKLNSRFKVYPLHSEISIDDQKAVFHSVPKTYRKVILSTNIAESSLTIPDVKYVIDSCLSKEIHLCEGTSCTSLLVKWASKANCQQRKGRCGRTIDGICIRLVTEAFYKTFIPEKQTPEILRTPLHNLLLQTKLLQFDAPLRTLELCLSPPCASDAKRSMLQLFESGGLIMKESSDDVFDGDMTFIGRIMAELPLEIHLSKLIALGYAFDVMEYCIIIAAVLSVRSIFRAPYKDKLKSLRHKLEWSGNSWSHLITMVNAFKYWKKNLDMKLLLTTAERKRFAYMHMLDMKRLSEASELYNEIVHRLQKFNIRVKESPMLDDCEESIVKQFDVLLTKFVIAGAFYPHYFIFNGSKEDDVNRMLRSRSPCRTVKIDNVPENLTEYKNYLQTAFATKCDSENATVDIESNCAYIQFPKKNYDVTSKPFLLNDPTIKTDVYPQVLLAVMMRDVPIPKTAAKEGYKKDATDNVREVLTVHVTKVFGFGHFLATVKDENDNDDHVIECRLYGVKSACFVKDSERDFLETFSNFVLNRSLIAVVIDVVNSVHFVELYSRGNKLSTSLINVGLAFTDPFSLTNAYTILKTPRSPLKICLRSLCRTLKTKHFLIDLNDVNAHMLDYNFTIKFDRLLIATEVRSIRSGQAFTLYGTTMMPPIAGLPSLLVLLFCRKSLIRTNEYNTHFISALCGLGCGATSYYQDHEIEIEFDCRITNDDLQLINRIRHNMNLILADQPGKNVDNIKPILRSDVFRLLCGQSRSLKLPKECILHPYNWQKLSHADENDTIIFPPHQFTPVYSRPKSKCDKYREFIKNKHFLLSRYAESNFLLDDAIFCDACFHTMTTKEEIILHIKSDIHNEKLKELGIKR